MIGILGAVPEEIDLLLKNLQGKSTRRIAGITFYRGRLVGRPVVVAASGVAKVNAAMATQILVDRFHVTHVIFNGTAGALAPLLKVGDLVISTKSQQYNVNFSAIGYPPGVIPYLATSVFPADPTLIRAARRGLRHLNFKAKSLFGKIVTGETFVTNRFVAKRLYRVFHGLCVETEGAATGQVGYLNKVPYLVIRGISDVPGGPITSRNARLAARRAQRLTMATLRQLPVA